MKYCVKQSFSREDISREINTEPEGTVKLEELIESDCKCVTITGAPKAGKTMLILKTIQNYLNSKKFEYIFYCNFNQESRIQPFEEINLFDFLTSKLKYCKWMNNTDTCYEVLDEIIKSENILLIMDHFDFLDLDEMKYKQMDNFNKSTRENIIMNILRGYILGKAKKIVISRPFNLEWMLMWPDINPPKHVSFLGINRQAQREIFEQNHSHLILNLFESSSIFPDIWSFSFSPYVCCLVEKSFHKKELFQLTTTFTFTSTFLKFVDRLNKDYEKNFNLEILAKFAFSQFSQSKLCFEKHDLSKEKLGNDCIRSFFSTLPCSSGDDLLDDDKYKSHFSHILIQEFLVALHLISLSEKQFLKWFNSIIYKKHYNVVLKFLFGLCDKKLNDKLKSKLSQPSFKNLNKNKKHLKANIEKSLCDQQDLKVIRRYCEYIHEMHDDEFTRSVMKPKVSCAPESSVGCYIRTICN